MIDIIKEQKREIKQYYFILYLHMQQYEVEAIIGKRFDSQRNLQYLVKWRNFPIEDSSWEPIKNLKNSQLLVQMFESQNSRKKTISVVPVQNDENDDEDFQYQLEKQKTRKKDDKQIQQYRRSKQKRDKLKQKQSRKNGRVDREGELQEQDDLSLKIDNQINASVLSMREKNGKTYFKVIEDGMQFWRNRNYMVEFFPESLFDFYEKLVIERNNKKN